MIYLTFYQKNQRLQLNNWKVVLHVALESSRTAECNIIILLSCHVIAESFLNLSGLDEIK